VDLSNDFDYEQLDPGIRKVVRWMRENGFETTDSGDGETKTDMDCAFDMPNVAVHCTRADLFIEADRLADMIRTHLPRVYQEVHIEASYDPMDRSCVLLLLRLHDRMLPW
jgi:hypothetical protein